MRSFRTLLISSAAACLLALAHSAAAYGYTFRIDTFRVIKNGTLLFEDTFSDGLPPPSAPNLTTGSPISYLFSGTFGPETGGKLTIDSSGAVIRGSIPPGRTFLSHRATLRTNIDSSDPIRGLKIGDAFTVTGLFDLIVPDGTVESYGISVTDRAPILGNIGDDDLRLGVVRSEGVVRVDFARADHIAQTFTTIASTALDPSHDQIELILSRPDISNALVFASFRYLDGGVPGPVAPLGSAEIFRGEDYTRARFMADTQVPDFETAFGLGANNSASLTREPVNTATGNYFYQRTDLAIPGRGMPLIIARSYNSQDSYVGPLGRGWTHSFNIFLTEDLGDGSVEIKQADGHTDFYTPTGGGNYTPQFGGVFDSLVKNLDGTFTLTKKNRSFRVWSGNPQDVVVDIVTGLKGALSA